MKKVQRLALNKVFATLAALDVKYKIVLEDGTCHTNMTEEDDSASKYSKRPYRNLTPFYKDAIANIEVGEVVVIEVPEGVAVERVRGTVAAQMYGRYGPGAHMSTVDGRKIEVLRLA